VTFATNGSIVLTNTITISANVILDGSGHSITISGGGAVQLINLPAGLSLTLRNLTLANAAVVGYGGAVYSDGNLTVENCVFTNNAAQNAGGGAIYNAGQLTISNTAFIRDSATGFSGPISGLGAGGAIYNAGGTVELSDVICLSNTATGGAADPLSGGTQSVPSGNGYGGAIYSSGGLVIATNLQFADNSAISPGDPFSLYLVGTASAGAVYIAGGNAVIAEAVFSNNFAFVGSGQFGDPGGSEGGAVFNNGSAFLDQCTFSGNTATGADVAQMNIGDPFASSGQGGAIYNSGSMLISGSLISENSAIDGTGSAAAGGEGGGLYNTGNASISATTICSNSALGGSASALGGGIANTGLIQLSNSALISNHDDASTNFGIAIYNLGTFLTDTNSFLTANTSGLPPLSFDWRINGTNIHGLTSSTVNLTNIQFTEAGTYGLVISNSAGFVTNFDEVWNQPLTNAPTIILQPLGEVTNLGATVDLFAAAVGFPAPTYQWFFDGTNLAGATTSTLILTNVLQNQSGTYTVVATNLYGSSTSQQAVLTVDGTILLTGADLGSGGFGIGGEGMQGMKFIIEVSTNLIDWQPLQTNASPFNFVDTNAPGSPSRFYRAVLAN
jgi:hypothetical protein